MNPTHCNLCRSSQTANHLSATDYISTENFHSLRCLQCGLIYVDPQPPATELHRYYPTSHQIAEPAVYEKMDAKPRIKLIANLENVSETKKILDIGTGKALLLLGLQDQGWDVYGTELSEVSRQYAIKQGLSVFNSTIEEAPLEVESLDVATLFHSLEHLTDPKASIEEIKQLLRPGGRVVIEVPNINSWYARLFKGQWFHYDAPRHLYHFTPQTLRRLIEDAGLQVENITTHANLPYDAFGAVQSLLNTFLSNKNLLNNINTGQTTFRELRKGREPFRNLAALATSQLCLSIGFPLFAIANLLTPWIEGGTLRIIAQKPPSQ